MIVAAFALVAGAAAPAGECALVADTGPHTSPLDDRVRLVATDAPGVADAVAWLGDHVQIVDLPGIGPSAVVAWWDPTLPASAVAYLVTDTLWTSRALRPYDPDTASALDDTLRALGHAGDGLHEVLFGPLPRLAFWPTDPDPVHGALIATCTRGDLTLQIRTPTLRYEARATTGHPAQFADSAVYEVLRLHHAGEHDAAARRLRQIVGRKVFFLPDALFWDRRRGVLVDAASRRQYDRFRRDASPYDVATFKVGLVLYAAAVLDVELPTHDALRAALWDAQWTERDARRVGHPEAVGGLAHAVRHEADGTVRRLPPTAEATAIAVLAESAE